MDLIDRYLGAVRWNLPSAKAEDIIAELADLIAARIEDREEALGRPLNRGEVSEVLREFGHPLSVAGEYNGRRALIGPEVFPCYWFVLRVVLAIVAVVGLIQFGGRVITGSAPFWQLAAHGFGDLFRSLLYNAAQVTLGFAVVERMGWLESYLAKWKPEELPDLSGLRLPARSARRRGPWEPVFEIVFGIAFLAWWAGSFPIVWIPSDAKVHIAAAPVWYELFWPVAAVVAARMLHGVVTLLRPGWKPLRAALILGCTAGTVAIATVLHHADRLLVVTGADAAQAADIQQGLDKGLAVAVIAVAAVTIWHGAVELWKLWREAPSAPPSAFARR